MEGGYGNLAVFYRRGVHIRPFLYLLYLPCQPVINPPARVVSFVVDLVEFGSALPGYLVLLQKRGVERLGAVGLLSL